jgi:acetyl esterase/lipase
MINYAFILVVISLPASLAICQYQPGSIKDQVRYLHPVFEDVAVEKDIVFGEVVNHEGETQKLLLDVYTPAGDKENDRPAILWIHGGGFRYGNDKSQRYIVAMANRFARRGYVCVSVDYRVRHAPRDDIDGTLKDALEDAMRGLKWLRDNCEKYNVDKDRIIVGGGSAGGTIAANLCYKDGNGSEKWDKGGIISHVNLWGVPDQSLMNAQVDANDPPTIIVHGTEDPLVPYANSERLIRELRLNKVKCTLIPIEDEGHTPAGHMDDFALGIADFLYQILSGR